MNILYVEDDAGDADLTRRRLAHSAPQTVLDVVTTLGQARERLAGPTRWDVVLTDLGLTDGNGLELIAEIRARALPVAVLVLTGATEVETAVAALRAGADDYLIKQQDYLSKLPGVIDAALVRFRTEAERRSRPLRLLYAVDDAGDLDLVGRHLARYAPHVRLEVVQTAHALLRRLPLAASEPCPCDVLLIDSRLTDLSGLDLLKVVRDERRLDVPVVLVAGQEDADVAVQAMRFGAAHYLARHAGYLFELPSVLESAHARAELAREQAALRASEDRYRDLVEHSSDMIITHDVDGRLLSVNQAACDMTGHSRAALLQMNLRDLLMPDRREQFGAYLDEITARGRASGLALIATATGEPRVWAYDNTLRRDGAGAGIVRGRARDITDRRRAERALAQSEGQLRLVWEISLDGMRLTDAAGRVLLVNEAYCRLMDRPRDALEGHLVSQAYLEAHATRVLERHRDRFRSRIVASFETEATLWNGKTLHLDVSDSFFDSPGQPTRLLSVFRDITERKQADAQLRESERRYERVVKHISDALVIDDVDGRVVYANQRFLELVGVSEEESRSLVFTDIAAPEVKDLLWDQHRRRMRGEDVVDHFEFRGLRRDGSDMWLDVVVEKIVENGQIVGTQSTLRDVTGRRLTELTLRVLSTSGAHLTGDAFFNEMAGQVARLLGTEIGFVGQLLHRPLARVRTVGLSVDGQVVPPVEFDLAGTPCEAAIAKGMALFPEHVQDVFPASQVIADLGVSGYAALSLVDSSGVPIGDVGVMSRTPLRRVQQVEAVLRLFAVRMAAELERRRSETKFQEFFEFSPDATLIVNREGRITAASRQAETMFGYSREELLGLMVEALMPEGGRTGHVELWRRFLSATTPRVMGSGRPGLQALRKDGTTFPVDISLSPIELVGGIEVVAAIRDTSDRAHAESERRSLEAQLLQAQKMESLGTLAGGIAHDFNNLLAVINGNVELGCLDVEPGHPVMKRLTAIGKAGDRAKNLVQQVLSFSRRVPLSRRVVSLHPMVEEAAGFLRATIPATVEFNVAIAEDVPDVLADATQIHQVLVNLCTNAWQALEGRPGRIGLRLDGCVVLEPATANAYGRLMPGRYARVSVSDTGVGIDAQALARIFEPFFTTRPLGEGTGLGLSVVHGIMRSHEGAISVTSRPGEGTTFSLHFPAAEALERPDDNPSEPDRAADLEPARRGQRILYVDDEEEVVAVVTALLQRLGFRAEGYVRPEEAIQALLTDPQRCDLVMTDLHMPEMSGLDLAQVVAHIRPDLPVVVTSGYVTDVLRDRTSRSGVRELLLKPVSAATLRDVVQRLTGPARTS